MNGNLLPKYSHNYWLQVWDYYPYFEIWNWYYIFLVLSGGTNCVICVWDCLFTNRAIIASTLVIEDNLSTNTLHSQWFCLSAFFSLSLFWHYHYLQTLTICLVCCDYFSDSDTSDFTEPIISLLQYFVSSLWRVVDHNLSIKVKWKYKF